MANDRYVVRRKDTGAGAVFKTRKEADAFLKANDGYALDGTAVESDAKAVESDVTEDKAVKPAQNKSRG